MSEEIIVGIDLGTTTSAACVYNGGQYHHIKGPAGNIIVPSVVGWDKDTQSIIAGHLAHNKAKAQPEDYVYEVKRSMGTDKKFDLGPDSLSAAEVSAHMLRHIKLYCEAHYDETIKRAVITVPANFNSNQRQDTKRAAELAGLTVERIIAEPTAAVLTYCMENTEKDDFVKVMIYDLGGGTFDVSVGEYHTGVLDIKGVAGDNELGGSDFDKLLADVFFDKLMEAYGIDFRKDGLAYHTVVRECENLKKELSFQTTSSINIPFLGAQDGKPIGLSETFTREQFEALIHSHLDRTSKAMNKALKSAEYKAADIDLILLVGGSSRIPLVKETVKKLMGKEPKADIDPDLAVSLGAAMQAAIIGGQSEGVIMDLVPHSFGTSAVQEYNGQLIPGFYSQIIEANAPMLKSYTKKYFTVFDNQEAVDFEVFQKASLAESIWAADLDFLGSKTIEGIPKNAAGEESITATYTYNLDGIIEVNILIDSTGNSVPFEIDSTNFPASADNLKLSVGGDVDPLDWESHELSKKYSSTIKLVQKKLDQTDNDALNTKLNELKRAICDDNAPVCETLDDELNDILFELEE